MSQVRRHFHALGTHCGGILMSTVCAHPLRVCLLMGAPLGERLARAEWAGPSPSASSSSSALGHSHKWLPTPRPSRTWHLGSTRLELSRPCALLANKLAALRGTRYQPQVRTSDSLQPQASLHAAQLSSARVCTLVTRNGRPTGQANRIKEGLSNCPATRLDVA